MSTVSTASPKVQYSVQRELSDGSLNRISVRVPYFSKDDIHVYVSDIEIKDTTVEGSKYTWRWDGDYIAITPNVDQGTEVLVRRITPIDEAIHIFDGRSEFDDQSMDENFQQLIYIAQEYSEGSGIKDVFSDINMHGYKIKNVGWATEDNDAVTYGQYKNDALGAHQAKDKATQEANRSEMYASQAKASAGTAVSSAKQAEGAFKATEILRTETFGYRNETLTARDESKQYHDALKDGLTLQQQIAPEVRIVAQNINSVVTDAQNIDDINVVSSDLVGSLSGIPFEDYGDLSDPTGSGTTITGGNIKVVADNIHYVRDNSTNMTHIVKVSGAIDQFPTMIDHLNAIKVQATDARDLAKKWANHIGSPVELGEYSAKHYANEAKKNADKTGTDLQALVTAKNSALSEINNSKNSAIALVVAEGSTQTKAVADKGVYVEGQVVKAGDTAMMLVESEGSTQKQAVIATGTAQKKIVTDAGATELQKVRTEGTTQVNLATTQATLASTKAKEADDAALQAHQSATEASASARNANSSASSATASATQARGSETAARTSADNAALSKNAAELAATRAEQAVAKVNTFTKEETTALLNKKLDTAVFDGFIDYGDLGSR